MKNKTIAQFVDLLPAHGRYTFSRDELKNAFDKTDDAIKLALNRLLHKGRIVSPKRGFYVVVPEQFKLIGAPPPVWYIDALMRSWHPDYYVGLLSAAQIHGVAHQWPEELQVITDAVLRPIEIVHYRIHFFKKWNVKEVPTIEHKTPTGTMKVSTPEATALDLVRYFETVGSYGDVVIVLSALSRKLNGQRLVIAAKCDVESAIVQRLGYFLDLIGKHKLVEPLHRWLSTKGVRITALRTDLDAQGAPVNRRWSLQINEAIEPSL
jgi:predicted transcriptional regulator of viral defense system